MQSSANRSPSFYLNQTVGSSRGSNCIEFVDVDGIIEYALNLFVIPLLKMQGSDTYGALTERINLLLSRENVTSSLYLAGYITKTLTLPLKALTEEYTVSKITADRQLIQRAVQESRLANLVSEDELQLIVYPTIKLPPSSQGIFKELETVLTQLQKHHAFSRRNDDDCINLTLYEDEPDLLQTIMTSLSQLVEYQQANLYSDIVSGTTAARQNKNHHWKGHQKKHYSLERPPQIFIRRAVDSEDEEPERDRRGKEAKRRYREVVREAPAPKPMFNNDDFPLLS